MTAIDVVRLAIEMRRAQKGYFRERTPVNLERSKDLERRFDREAAELLVQPSLFGPAPEGEAR